jgi:two-component system cell cycle sensor histidine kinase/response regulator CckA
MLDELGSDGGPAIRLGLRRIERREWWLWSSAVLVTILLTLGLASFVVPILHQFGLETGATEMTLVVRGLIGLVLLFDIYIVFQQLQIYRIRRRLFEREEVFRLITENAADMIAVVDGNGNRVYNSPAYQKLLGYSLEELQSTPTLEQVHPDDQQLVREAAIQARTEGIGRQIEYRMRHKNGTWRILESTASAVRSGGGKIEHLVIVNRDITDRRRLEEQFRQAQKMDAIGRLSGGIAHDFNNLLGVIIGYTEILQENTEESDPDRSCVDEILRAGQRAASLTRQLLAFSRQQVLEPKVLDLNDVISDMEKMLRRLIGEDIELTTVLHPTLGNVRADQGQFEQVILNVAVNARDAMPHGGKFTITTENVIMGEAEIRRYSYPFRPGHYVLLTVSDTGTGMDLGTQARIFEPFYTTKEKGKGTGLGLATVYGVVKQSDGYIEVHSEVGAGTTFKIYLPIVEAHVEPESSQPALISSLQGHETILLVEDDDVLRILARNMLLRFGYTVLEASNGADACDLARKRVDPIHLLLTDVVMPGMNGRELGERLEQERPDLKVVYMSGYTGQGVGQGMLPSGCNFIAKPFHRENLARKLREALGTTSESSVPSKAPAAQPVSVQGDTR